MPTTGRGGVGGSSPTKLGAPSLALEKFGLTPLRQQSRNKSSPVFHLRRREDYVDRYISKFKNLVPSLTDILPPSTVRMMTGTAPGPPFVPVLLILTPVIVSRLVGVHMVMQALAAFRVPPTPETCDHNPPARYRSPPHEAPGLSGLGAVPIKEIRPHCLISYVGAGHRIRCCHSNPSRGRRGRGGCWYTFGPRGTQGPAPEDCRIPQENPLFSMVDLSAPILLGNPNPITLPYCHGPDSGRTVWSSKFVLCSVVRLEMEPNALLY